MPSDLLPAAPTYVRQAVADFEAIMANAHKEQIRHMNQGNQGELFVLKYLYMHKQTSTPSELRQAMDSSPARISAVLKVLEQKEQVTRQIDLQDRRQILVTITEKGRERVKRKLGKRRQNLGKVFAALGEADTREFLRLSALFSDLTKAYLVGSDP